MSNFKRCPSVNVQFQDLTFSVKVKKNIRNILHSLNGSFNSGDLIGILGPSGAGKTTLLNILAGKILEGISGNIKINGVQRELKTFQKLSCYIMQEDLVQKQLTVKESMNYACYLKLGNNIDAKNADMIVDNIINSLGLQETKETRVENLSGGQRKRLIIALELINNPPVIFLDEPTTGLDNIAAKQCFKLLKDLAKQGRTVICTIHQPSDLLFSFFDQVYFMSNGLCVYDGSVNAVVPFLQKNNYPCPSNSSPADFLIELSGDEETTNVLSTATNNGKIIMSNQISNSMMNSTEKYNDFMDTFQYRIPFHVQVYVLLSRMCLQLSRNKINLGIQLIVHIICPIAAGISFYGVGNNANQAIANYKLQLGVILFYVYCPVLGPSILFPFELELIKREYFNHWYSLKAYYTALMLYNTPLMIILSVIFNCIIYIMTDQPMEITRFIYYNIAALITALSSYGIGLTIGSTLKATKGAIFASISCVTIMTFCIYGLGYENSIAPIMKFVMFLDYARHGLEGLCASLWRGRGLLECKEEIYCYLRDPESMLKLMGMAESSVGHAIIMSTIYLILIKLMAYLVFKRAVKLNVGAVVN